MERRLAAILAADVVGYSRLMGRDEAGTRARLRGCETALIEPIIAAHRGRIVKRMGDGYLVEFASVVAAVECAIAWQAQAGEREREAEPDQRIKFRIGINLGDVIVEGDDIHGDGVNVAARLEALAEPGSVILSEDAFRQVKGKLDLPVDDLGERRLKNIAEPLRVFRIAVAPDSLSSKNATADGRQDGDLSMPDHPSIAVLPFAAMSADPDQEFFADGIVDNIITTLSKIGNLLVVARNSTFTYKGRAVDVKQVSREQGVRYVLEGSVRKAGGRVRVTAQLIDATRGNPIWSERYDRELEDIFAVQDEITREVVTALDVQLREGEQARLRATGTTNLEAWEAVRLGYEHVMNPKPEHQAVPKSISNELWRWIPAMQWHGSCWAGATTTRPTSPLPSAIRNSRRRLSSP